MKKLSIIICFGLLTACSTIPNPATINQLATLESTYGIALSSAVAYRNLRMCKKSENPTPLNICAKRYIIIKLQDADKLLAEISRIRKQEDSELENWNRDLENVKEKLLMVDKQLFET